MGVPSVTINEIDNQIGVAIATGDILALVGVSSSGTVEAPAVYTRTKDVIADFGAGPLVECASWMLEEGFASQLLLVKTSTTTAGGYGTIDDDDVAGTSAVTAHTATAPFDEYDVVVVVTLGGTIGTGPISYKYSLDNGRSYSIEKSLGTQNHLDIAEGNIRFDFGAGTLVTGDVFTCRTTAPIWNTTQLGTAMTALKNSTRRRDLVLALGVCDASAVAALSTAAAASKAAGKYIRVLCNVRSPSVGESDATYQTSILAAFASTTASRLCVGAGYARIQSPISNNQYRRPAIWAIAGRLISIAAGTDAARVLDGPLPASVQITDDDGNPDEHDEFVEPGLDDARFSTLRTWPNRSGVWINGARLFSALGSDFVYVQHGRVMDKAAAYAADRLSLFSSDDVLVDPSSGFILESEAADIEQLVTRGLQTALVDPRYVSAAAFTLSRTDNLLSTFQLDGAIRVTPKGYIKSFVVDLGLFNPANAPTEG